MMPLCTTTILPGAVAMRVRVFLPWDGHAWPSVCVRCRKCLQSAISLRVFLKVPQFSGRAAGLSQLAVVHYGNSGGVVAAVLQLAPSLQLRRGRLFFGSYVNRQFRT